MAQIVKVTSKGTFSPAITRTRISPTPLGKVIDGVVWQYPRLKLNRLSSGGSVKITTPRIALTSANARTASLGMGGVGQRGRVRDVGATARGEA